jgi:hypothetical protein
MMPSSDRLDSKTLRPAATILAHEQDRQGHSRRRRHVSTPRLMDMRVTAKGVACSIEDTWIERKASG